jgi:hypothetical protein
MKKLIALLLISLSATAMAQHHHHRGGYHGGYHGGGGWGWIAPAVIGGAVVYAATRPQVVVQQPPVVLQQSPVIVQQPNDIVYIDGLAYRKQLMLVNGAYQEVLIRM